MKIIVCFCMLFLISPFVFGIGGTGTGPKSELYLTFWSNQGLGVVQGTSIVRSWASSGSGEISIAVLDNQVKTYAHMKGNIGAAYSTSGTFLGTTYNSTLDPRSSFEEHDGTTDGTYFYSVNYANGGVYRYNLSWQNPQLLFQTNQYELGITYDPTNNSLWIGGWGSGTIRNYSMTGVLLSSFTVSDAYVGALALDHADGTLWMAATGSNTTLKQYSKQGTFLSSANYSFPGAVYGAEFAYVVPEPASFCLLALALLLSFKYRLSKK